MPTPAAKKLRIESFRPGTHTSSDGTRLTFSADDVRAIATGYDAANAPAPIVVGHPKTDDPAFGWCAGFSYDEERERLIADTGELAPAFADSVAAGHYKKVSMALFAPDHPANPKPGQWYPRHLGFLGAAPPAVTGLKPVAFADDGKTKVIEVEFAATGWAIKDLFSRLRDYWIDKFGLEEADKAMPSYLIESCDSPPPSEQPYYAAPPQEIEPMPAPNATPNPAPAANAAELTAAQARITELETQLTTQRTAAAKASAAEFCAGLVTAKKLLPADRPALEAALVAIDAAAPVEFDAGDGAKKSEAPSAVIRRLLGAKNPLVSGVETTAAEEPAPVASFSAPGGKTVDPKDAALHAKAKAFQAAHAGTDFATALRAVSAG